MFARTKDKPSAKITGDTLVISLPNAIDPVVWRMDMGNVREAALEVRKEKTGYSLILKKPGNDQTGIAAFDSKEEAGDALIVISQALQQNTKPARSQQDRHPVATMPTQAPGRSWLWLIPLGLIVLAVFLLSRSTDMLSVEYTPPGDAVQSGETGVPLSADQVLGNMPR